MHHRPKFAGLVAAAVLSISTLLSFAPTAQSNATALRTLLRTPVGRAMLATEEGLELARTMKIRHRLLRMPRERIGALPNTEFQQAFDELAAAMHTKLRHHRASNLERELKHLTDYFSKTMEDYRLMKRNRGGEARPGSAASERLYGLTLDEHILIRLLANRRLKMNNTKWVEEALGPRPGFLGRARNRINTRKYFLNEEPPAIVAEMEPLQVLRTRRQFAARAARHPIRAARNVWGEMRSCLRNQSDGAANKDWGKWLMTEIGLGWTLTYGFHAHREGVNRGAEDNINPADFFKAMQMGYKHVKLRDLGTDLVMGTLSDIAKFYAIDKFAVRPRTGMAFLDPKLTFDVLVVRGWGWQQVRNMVDLGMYVVFPSDELIEEIEEDHPQIAADAQARKSQVLGRGFRRYQFNTVWAGAMAGVTPSLILFNQGMLCMTAGGTGFWSKATRILTGVLVRGGVKIPLSYYYFKFRNRYVYGDAVDPADDTEGEIQDLLQVPMSF